jgi:hypothetical protein
VTAQSTYSVLDLNLSLLNVTYSLSCKRNPGSLLRSPVNSLIVLYLIFLLISPTRAIVLDCRVLRELPIIDIVLIDLSVLVPVSVSAYSVTNDGSSVKSRCNNKPGSSLR